MLNNIFVQLFRIVVGAVFIYSGFVKLNDPWGTAYKLEEYFAVFGLEFLAPASLVFSVFLCVFEVVLGIAVLLFYEMKRTAWMLLLLIVFFTFLTGYSTKFNVVSDCGCFGDAIKLEPKESFVKDVILLVMISYLWWQRRLLKPLLPGKIGFGAVAFMTIASTIFAVQCIRHLPVIDFRVYKVGENLAKLKNPMAFDETLKPVYEYTFMKVADTTQTKTTSEWLNDPDYKYKDFKIVNEEAISSKIPDFVALDEQGNDVTDSLFNGNYILITSYNVEKAADDNVEAIKKLVNSVNTNVEIVFLSASMEAASSFLKKNELDIPNYAMDGTTLKTIVRSNPGLVLLKDGVIKAKWHHNDTPTLEEVMVQLKD